MPNKPKVQFNKTPAEILQERRARAAANAEQMAGIKKSRQPLGGAPPVKVPPLNAQPIEGGGSMADQAEVLQDPTSPLSPAYSPELAAMQQQGALSPLPPSVREDPNFMPGVGSMIAGNQPFIGQGKNPVQQTPGRPPLSQETKDGLQALGDFYAQATKAQQDASQQTPRPDQSAVPSEEDSLDEDLELTRQEIENILSSSNKYNVLAAPERRKKIESQLSPLDVTDIIVHGELRQTIPLLPNLSVVYRTVSGEEDLEIKRMMFGMKGGDLYMGGRYDTMQLTLALVGVNDKELPTHLKNGFFDKELFEAKYRLVLRFPVQLIADFCVQYSWFDERVREMLAGQTEALKNT